MTNSEHELEFTFAKNEVYKNGIGDVDAHLKPQKITVSLDL